MVDPRAEPEQAIAAFERLHRLIVTCHDPSAALAHWLEPGRHEHRHPCCRAVKLQRETDCIAFDHHAIWKAPELFAAGRMRVCHGGLVEWVLTLPVSSDGHAILFAGARAPGDLPGIERARRPLPEPDGLAPVDADEALDLLEALRQLGARLRLWLAEHAPAACIMGAAPERDRAWRIRQFLAVRAREEDLGIDDLATELGLSVDRAKHVVGDLLGVGFHAALTRHRLTCAAAALRWGHVAIAEVAFAHGFRDLRTFQRTFRARYGCTPAAWRARV